MDDDDVQETGVLANDAPAAPKTASVEDEAPAKPPRPLSPQQQAENTLKEAFPSIDAAVVKAVLRASGGQVEPAFNALLGKFVAHVTKLANICMQVCQILMLSESPLLHLSLLDQRLNVLGPLRNPNSKPMSNMLDNSRNIMEVEGATDRGVLAREGDSRRVSDLTKRRRTTTAFSMMTFPSSKKIYARASWRHKAKSTDGLPP
jgi:hypothetical protein